MQQSVESLADLAVFFGGAFILSVIINAIMLRFVQTLGMRHQSEMTIRWSSKSKPAVGGISFYISFLMGFMFLRHHFWSDRCFSECKPSWVVYNYYHFFSAWSG